MPILMHQIRLDKVCLLNDAKAEKNGNDRKGPKKKFQRECREMEPNPSNDRSICMTKTILNSFNLNVFLKLNSNSYFHPWGSRFEYVLRIPSPDVKGNWSVLRMRHEKSRSRVTVVKDTPRVQWPWARSMG
jgi:hypothetical protein